MSPHLTKLRKLAVAGALVTGASLGAAGIASAATSSTAKPSTGSAPVAPYGAPRGGAPMNPAAMAHGPNQTLLTGTALEKADAAARAAVPGATVVRAETDSSKATPYEVHMKADGTYVTVELNSSFEAVKTVSGFGACPGGGRPPAGTQPPAGAPPPASSSAA